jgi:FkbM family methyltransferase
MSDEVYVQYLGGPNIELIENYFMDLSTGEIQKNGTVVECGAAEGHFNPSLTLEGIYGWKYYAFEPDDNMYPILCYKRPNAEKLKCALSNFIGKAKFYESAHNGNSSLKHSDVHKNELNTYKERFQDGSITKEIEVDVVNWQWFIDKYSIKTVNLLTLDVEGHELTVLDGIKSTSVYPEVIQVEFLRCDFSNSLLDEAKKQNYSGFVAISKMLYGMGYEFNYVSDSNAHFSLKSFWANKPKPENWSAEEDKFEWLGYSFYDKALCKELIKDL